ncbi:MAG: DUF4345 family protein [Terracidiphilus sp.]
MLNFLRKAFFYGYVWMFICVGASGIFIAAWELPHIFNMPMSSLTPDVRATMLTQYRFLKSAELSYGLFSFFFRNAIFAGGSVRKLFVIAVFLGVSARVLSVFMDGMPAWEFLAFAALECVTGILIMTAPVTASKGELVPPSW